MATLTNFKNMLNEGVAMKGLPRPKKKKEASWEDMMKKVKKSKEEC